MNANGGLGEVKTTEKNIAFTTAIASEALTAVPNATGDGYWVITYNYGSSDVYAIPFSSTGPGAVVTTTLPPPAHGLRYGTINVSPDMTRIALYAGNSTAGGLLRLLDFDATTGVFTEKAQWANSGTTAGYSVDFSPDGKYLYAANIFANAVYRYDISSEVSATILASETLIGVTGNSGGAIKRGPDGKMYLADHSNGALAVINDPDNPNAASVGFATNSFSLAPNLSLFGLPQMVTGCPRATPPVITPVPANSHWMLGSMILVAFAIGVRGWRRRQQYTTP